MSANASTAAQPTDVTPRPVGADASHQRIRGLDGLRGVAILLVLVMHYYIAVPTAQGIAVNDFLRRVFRLSFVGVDLFFVLSGFLIGGILLDHRASSRMLPAFYARRSFRIVPVYLLLLASFFAARSIPALSALYHGAYFWTKVPTWTFFGFVQNIAAAWQRDIGPLWLLPTWSLAIEEQFYLLIPILVQRLRRRELAIVGVIMILVSPALRLAALLYGDNGLAASVLLPMRADGLLWGVLCAIMIRDTAVAAGLRARSRALAAGCVVLGAVVAWLSWQGYASSSWQLDAFGYSVCDALFAGLLLQVVLKPDEGLAKFLSARWLCGIGVTSYFIYLFHTPVWYFLQWIFFHSTPSHLHARGAAVTLLALVVTLVAARLSWRWFEAPLLKWAKRFSYE